MFSVNNIVRQTLKDKRKFLVVCSNTQEYVKNLEVCKEETFYILRGDRWSIPLSQISDNIRIIKSGDINLDSNITAVISVGTAEDFDMAKDITLQLGVPMIQVHTAGLKTYMTHPFSAGVQRRPFKTVGDINVSINRGISCFEEQQKGSNEVFIEIPNIKIQKPSSSKRKDNSIIHINAAVLPDIMKKFQAVLHEHNLQPYERKEPHNVSVFIETWVGDTTIPLEIMQHGGIVFLPYSEEAESIVQDGKSGFVYRDFPDLKGKIEHLNKTKGLSQKISKRSKEASLDLVCDEETFRSSWSAVFDTLQYLKSRLDNWSEQNRHGTQWNW